MNVVVNKRECDQGFYHIFLLGCPFPRLYYGRIFHRNDLWVIGSKRFESGEIDEKIELMHNDVKELKHEIDELKLLLQELRVNMKKESE